MPLGSLSLIWRVQFGFSLVSFTLMASRWSLSCWWCASSPCTTSSILPVAKSPPNASNSIRYACSYLDVHLPIPPSPIHPSSTYPSLSSGASTFLMFFFFFLFSFSFSCQFLRQMMFASSFLMGGTDEVHNMWCSDGTTPLHCLVILMALKVTSLPFHLHFIFALLQSLSFVLDFHIFII